MKPMFMTPKERVIERYPSAFSYSLNGSTTIYAIVWRNGPAVKLGHGHSAAAAWRDAADALVADALVIVGRAK